MPRCTRVTTPKDKRNGEGTAIDWDNPTQEVDVMWDNGRVDRLHKSQLQEVGGKLAQNLKR